MQTHVRWSPWSFAAPLGLLCRKGPSRLRNNADTCAMEFAIQIHVRRSSVEFITTSKVAMTTFNLHKHSIF